MYCTYNIIYTVHMYMHNLYSVLIAYFKTTLKEKYTFTHGYLHPSIYFLRFSFSHICAYKYRIKRINSTLQF